MKYWRTPLDTEEVFVTRGIVHIIEDRCKGCGYCIEYCPKDVLVFSSRFNAKGYHPPEVSRPDDCVNCHYCEIICPDFAIYSVEDPSSQAESGA
ncbi:MAG: 4Fe-4S binding protein [Syntrophobacteraceae bacterium]|jgi:2-oxoglutarate ferredoxin oxidoreductase subunit delta|nr:4Fe-4S binding protein [Syntrophobacteraceae bacterium]